MLRSNSQGKGSSSTSRKTSAAVSFADDEENSSTKDVKRASSFRARSESLNAAILGATRRPSSTKSSKTSTLPLQKRPAFFPRVLWSSSRAVQVKTTSTTMPLDVPQADGGNRLRSGSFHSMPRRKYSQVEEFPDHFLFAPGPLGPTSLSKERSLNDIHSCSSSSNVDGSVAAETPSSPTRSVHSSEQAKAQALARRHARRRHRTRTSSVSECSDIRTNSSSFDLDSDHLSVEDLGDFEEVECLMPNGIVLDLLLHLDEEMFHIKQLVLNKATTDENLPLRGCLNPDGSLYLVTYVSSEGKMQDCYDETKTLRELKPFQNILKFGKRSKDRGHYQFRQNIGSLIGKSLNEFEDLRNCEVNDFRWRMKVFANRIAQERKNRLNLSLPSKIQYQYPPRLVSQPGDQHTFGPTIKINLRWGPHVETEADPDPTPEALLNALGERLGYPTDDLPNYFLKTVGEDSFLAGGARLIDYAFVRERVADQQSPRMEVLHARGINIEQAHETVYISLQRDCEVKHNGDPVSARNASITAMSLSSLGISLSSYNTLASSSVERSFSVTVESITLSPESALVGVFRSLSLQLGLFHGGKLLSGVHLHNFKATNTEDEGALVINKTFIFEIPISQLPRMSKLCIGIVEKRRGGNVHPLFWANSNLFDYRAKLKWKQTLHMWNYSPGHCMPTFSHLSPLRQTLSNPNIKEAADLVLTFENGNGGTEEEPNLTKDTSCSYIEFQESEHLNLTGSSCGGAESCDSGGSGAAGRTISKMFTQELEKIADRDPLYDITEQEKDLIWQIREYCLSNLPELLPRIIDCVQYINPNQVLELHCLLERWPLLPPERALQLLDYAYPDECVRRFAVRCLREASDDVLLRYLLQLAQALKHENYLQSDLVELLLERALNNQHIGHYLFWELRAEMNSPSVGLLYGLILEVYLSAAPEHLRILERQHTLLEKCRSTQLMLTGLEGVHKSHEKFQRSFKTSCRSQFDGHHPYVNFVCPLNPGLRCLQIILDQCKLMKSKMRPQLLSFSNADCSLGHNDLDDVVLIYKRGDDLRQDRLTLQLLAVMDRLWKREGMDLRMNLYRCMSTDVGEGFIEVVRSAETVCKIQMAQTDYKTTAAFRKGLLLQWLKANNGDEMKQVQWEFTQSCAGYSVAAYILGLGDRHNDNIMMKPSGQLFHIDFGHFLGNFKHKFGIRRERVPMVLSSEFVEIIKADFGQPHNFERFRSLCETAFMTIRRHGSLIISLLAMMISTGLPELSSENDLNVIRANLHLDRTDEVAIEMFRRDFNDSLRNAWTISIDWWFHMLNQLRRKGA